MEWIVEAECREDLVDGHWFGGEELVRCKDCICGEERVDKNHLTYWFCTFAKHPTAKYNYCMWGKKKDNE